MSRADDNAATLQMLARTPGWRALRDMRVFAFHQGTTGMQAQDVLLRRAGWGAVQSCRAMRLDDPRAFIATAPQRLTLHMTEARAAMSSEERL